MKNKIPDKISSTCTTKMIVSKSLKLNILFWGILLVVAFYYNYQEYLFSRPQSIHAWRQADCASISLNYYQHGMNFFQPEVHNQTSDGGTTGYSATSEAPILYYLVAVLYKIFGVHESFLRGINLLLFFFGLYYLYRLTFKLTQQPFWSISISLLFFTSPLFVYYGNNFLTNTSGLSLAIIGWYHFYNYTQTPSRKSLLISMLFFLLAGLLKIPALMSLFAIVGYFILENISFVHKKRKIIIIHKTLFVIGFFIALLLIIGWILYAHYYNKVHQCYYFSTTIFPIWDLTQDQIGHILFQMKNYWLYDYFHPSVLVLIGFLLIYMVSQIKRMNRFALIVLVLLILQSLMFFALQFWTFRDHDYYLIGQYIVPIFIVLMAIVLFTQKKNSLLISTIMKVGFFFLIVFNIHHAKGQLSDRYESAKNSYKHQRSEIYEIEAFLRDIGIRSEDKVIYIPDNSNVSLYLMNQPGWTQYSDAQFNKGERTQYNTDSIGIQQSIDHGAKYLIINSLEDLIMNSFLMSYTKHFEGQFGNVLIFDLMDDSRNCFIETDQIINQFICNAEIRKGNLLETNRNSILLENGDRQSNDIAFQGNKSICVFSPHKYGMTFKTQNFNSGDVYVVTVYRKGNEEAGIVAECENDFYINKNTDIEQYSNGWQKIKLEFSIPPELIGKELRIYLYNPTNEPTYFDNLKITQYQQPKLVKYK